MVKIKITKEKFKNYLKVKKLGRINMFDVKTVLKLSGNLTRDECLEIMENYNFYYKKYGI